MPFSHHSHSGEFCKHASGTLEEVVLEAIRQRFKVYGLTEHVPRHRMEDLYPEESSETPQSLVLQFDRFIEEAHRLKSVYASEITILVGAETEFITDLDLTSLSLLLERHRGRIEYLVGSVHHVNGIPIDFDEATFRQALESFLPQLTSDSSKEEDRMSLLLENYFDAQYRLMEQFRPEVIGHLDLCRLYRPQIQFHSFPGALQKLERNIRFACSYGALFELNATAFRKGWDSAYPGNDVLELVVREGGQLTLSDDSHGPQAVGLNYGKLYKYLREMNVEELWYLEKGDARRDGRYLRPAKLEKKTWLKDFWLHECSYLSAPSKQSPK